MDGTALVLLLINLDAEMTFMEIYGIKTQNKRRIIMTNSPSEKSLTHRTTYINGVCCRIQDLDFD